MSSISPPDVVKTALAQENAVIIDIRGEDEIKATGRYEIDRKWFNAPGSIEENEILEKNVEEWIPDKHGKSTFVRVA